MKLEDGSRYAELRNGSHHGMKVRIYPTRKPHPDYGKGRVPPFYYEFEDLILDGERYVVPRPLPEKKIVLHHEGTE